MPRRARRPLEGAAARGVRTAGRRASTPSPRARAASCRGRTTRGRHGTPTSTSSSAREAEAFAARWLGAGTCAGGPAPVPPDLMEAQRWRLAMFACDGWFWDDPIATGDPPGPALRRPRRAARRRVAGTDLEPRLVEDLDAPLTRARTSTARRSTGRRWTRGASSGQPTRHPPGPDCSTGPARSRATMATTRTGTGCTAAARRRYTPP